MNPFPEELATMIAQAESGDGDVADRRLSDGRLAVLVRSPSPEIRYRIEAAGGGCETTYPVIAFKALAMRPDDYPEDLPFVAGRPVVVGIASAIRLLAWASPADRQRLVDELLGECAQTGWTVTAQTSHWLGVRRHEMRRNDRRRLLIDTSFPVLVELLEMPWPVDGPDDRE